MDLGDRKQKILACVVESYIASGEPVGSKALVTQAGFAVSSATIRNELADLVNKGYLKQPHTSAGRVPTQKGYRYYIDNLMGSDTVSYKVKEYIEQNVAMAADAPEKILAKTAQVLSELSGMAAVTTTPGGDNARVHKIRFVITGRHTCMVVLITSNGMVKSRLFRCSFVLTPELIALFDKALNESFVGVPLKDINQGFLQTVAASFGELSLFMPDVLIAILDATSQAMQSTVSVFGATNLLFLPSYDMLCARNVLKFLSDEASLSQLLNENPKGTKVYIGNESGHYELQDSCVITTRYEIGSVAAGAIALIGPVRTDYKKLIAQIEFASSCVSGLIGELLEV